jgi:hypothetical protein
MLTLKRLQLNQNDYLKNDTDELQRLLEKGFLRITTATWKMLQSNYNGYLKKASDEL